MIYKQRATSCSKHCFHIHRHYSRTKNSADAILRGNEQTILLEDHAIARVDVCQVAANRPVEDFFSAAKCLSSNAHLFGVFDGHDKFRVWVVIVAILRGAGAARQVSTRLFDYICASVLEKHTVAEIPLNERIQWLFSSTDTRLPSFVRDKHLANLHEFHEK